MIRANVSLQISRGIFVHGEIIQIRAFHESNYTVMKLPCNENNKAKKSNKKQFSLYKLSNTTNGMDPFDNFYTDHPFID